MKWFGFVLAASAVAVAGCLVGCGGGGGSSGGGGFLPIAPAAPVAALTVNVSINGTAATSGGNGQFSVKPGDTVEITPSQSADWTTSDAAASTAGLRNPNVTATKWSAQIVNSTTVATTYTITAKASANAALTKDTVLNVAAGDTRNGTYKVFATNSAKPTLALDFDAMSYAFTDADGVVSTDVFSVDTTTAGTYMFKSARNTVATNNARFRLATDTIVGAFPFEVAQVAGSYAVQPFVASRALVTAQNQLDGIYTRFGLTMTAATRNSDIRKTKISGGGTLLFNCNEVAITAVDACPAASLVTYNITPGATPDAWRVVNAADPADVGAFSVAKVAGQNVYLSAGVIASTPTSSAISVFRIGLSSTAVWPSTAAIAADTNGTWGSLNFDATTYGSTVKKGDGTSASVGYALSFSGIPEGLAIANPTGPNIYFGMQNGALSAVVGARGGPVAGYLQIGLMN
ncbi:hypothetical protein QN397_11420 [Variovorax sp. RTB1]|uniref:hypothetical protein n=1 Tax=Variovorax sp. RTB1 TaxID=3048631 RepID=UPI002B23D585|nr:hypothetical protein [Variovorax sp. RTB1]MEB0111961.1 hypothetical protein [Variovorax sp. RTB1]